MSYFLTREEKMKICEIKSALSDIQKRLRVIESLGSCLFSVVPFDGKEIDESWRQVVVLCNDIIKLTGGQ